MSVTITPELTNSLKDTTYRSTREANKTQEDVIGLSNNLDTFLEMLTTQLKNQDPTEPLDTNEFTKQLTEFSSIEQQIATNRKLDEVIALNELSQTSMALGYLGHDVEFESQYIQLSDGQSKFVVDVAEPAQAVKVSIMTGDGSTVFEKEMTEVTEGGYLFEWDGKNAEGVDQEEGVYFLQVEAVDKNNEKVDIKTNAIAKVLQVIPSEAGPVLSTGAIEVDPTLVVSARPHTELQTPDNDNQDNGDQNDQGSGS